MNDLLEIFGLDEEDLKVSDTKETKNKKDKKEKKSHKGTNFQLPIAFCAGHLRCIFEDATDKSWSEETLKNRIREKFRELAGVFFKISILDVAQKEVGVNTYIVPEFFFKEFSNEEKLEFPLEVVAGGESLWIDTKNSLEEIGTLWVTAHPEYSGCKFHYDEKQKLLLPFMEQNAPGGKKYKLPVTVGYLRLKEEYQKDDFDKEEVSEDELRKRYAEKYPEYTKCVFAYQEEQNLLFPILDVGKEENIKSISLPVEIKAGGFTLTVEPEDVKGKSSASLEEIRKVLENNYPEYSKERTEMLYDKKHFVVPILKSSKKGVVITSNVPGWKHEIYEDENHDKWRVETTPFGVFRYNMTRKEKAQFLMTAPKIPWSLAEEINRIFERNPIDEFAVQIFYDSLKQNYELYVPEQKVSKSAVIFTRNTELERKKVLVMDVHSHGSFKAFFSEIDDRDEQGIRLYMVFGNMNKKEHSYALRAGIVGNFCELSLDDVFEKEEQNVYTF